MRSTTSTAFVRCATLLLSAAPASAALLSPVESPPVLNSPVFSLATLNPDGSTNMNILTYATPAGVKPRLWAISLFRKTRTHANFVSERSGILQLLSEPHSSLVYTLGGQSAADVDKAAACADAGFGWLDGPGEGTAMVLPGCASYIRLVQVGELQDAGEHDLALCRVEEFLVEAQGATDEVALSTAALREAGIITDRGKAIEPK